MPTSPASERAEIRSLHASWFWKCPPHTGRKHDTPIALPVSHGGPMSYPLSLPPPRTRLWAFYPISRHWTTERFILAIATTYLPESEIRRSPSVSLTEDTRVQRRPQGHGTTRPQPSQSWYRSSAHDTEYGVPHVCIHMPSTYVWDHGLLIPDSKTSRHQALLICWPTRQSLWSRKGERPAFAKQLLTQSLGQAQRTRGKKLLIISL